jgi:hypothetical protein
MSPSLMRIWPLEPPGGEKSARETGFYPWPEGAPPLALSPFELSLRWDFFFPSDPQLAQVFPRRKEIFEPAMVAHDSINDLSSRFNNLRRHLHDLLQKTPEFHPACGTTSLPRLRSGMSNPNHAFKFQARAVIIPRLRDPVAFQVIDRHAHGVDRSFELRDHILLIGA